MICVGFEWIIIKPFNSLWPICQCNHCQLSICERHQPDSGRTWLMVRGGAPVLFHFAAREMAAAVVDVVAEAVVGFGEEGGFHDAGFVFEGGKRHGVAGLGAQQLAGDPQGSWRQVFIPAALHMISQSPESAVVDSGGQSSEVQPMAHGP